MNIVDAIENFFNHHSQRLLTSKLPSLQGIKHMLPVVHRTWVFVMQLAVNWQDGICPCVAEKDDSPQKLATEFVIDLFDVFENAHLQVGHATRVWMLV